MLVFCVFLRKIPLFLLNIKENKEIFPLSLVKFFPPVIQ